MMLEWISKRFIKKDLLSVKVVTKVMDEDPVMIPEDKYFRSMIIDIVDACNLSCPTCPRGAGEIKSTSRIMDLKMYNEIIKKGMKEGYAHVCLYNWTEPFINKNLFDYVKIAKEANMSVWLSSNLALHDIPHLHRTLAAGVDVLVISMSGSNSEVHEINHVGGGWVFKNMKILAEVIKYNDVSTKVYVQFLKFPYNHSCESILKEMVTSMGFDFSVVPGEGDPFSNIQPWHHCDQFASKYDKEVLFRKEVCSLMINHVPIDSSGNVYLCCARPNTETYLIGNYLDLDFGLLRTMRSMHSACTTCRMNRLPMSHELYENMVLHSGEVNNKIDVK